MKNIFLPPHWGDGASRGLATHRRELALWWQHLPAGLRLPLWPRLLASLVILGMLLTFHQVVRGAVQQGELLRKASALQTEANWRCNSARDSRANDSCRLLQLNAAARGESVIQAQNLTTGTTIE